MRDKNLNVAIGGTYAGTLVQTEAGALQFAYDEGYRGVPLSLSMPLSTRTYQDRVVRPYIWGLLPEDQRVRQSIVRQSGMSPNNPFSLLTVMGLDCPGAVQFFPDGMSLLRDERLAPISDFEIAERLSCGRLGGSSWLSDNEHWSLAGQQSKFALRRKDSRWYSCEGSSPTTHIFKSGVMGLSHQALDEYVCMRTAEKCGVRTAHVSYCEFEGRSTVEPAIVIERYDRMEESGSIIRLHQEDMCQVLGCLPERKYAQDGGPGVKEIVECLKATNDALLNVAEFLQMLFFNYLIVGTDAHAKNYSLMLMPGGAVHLAPMYDVASMAPYIDGREWKHRPPRLAMSIGGENRAGRITASHIARLVEQCGLDALGITKEGCIELLVSTAGRIPAAIADVFNELEATSCHVAACELRTRMEAPIAELCRKTKSDLS